MDIALATTVVEIFFQTVSRSNKREKIRKSVKQRNREKQKEMKEIKFQEKINRGNEKLKRLTFKLELYLHCLSHSLKIQQINKQSLIFITL
jgi:Flp pilus assembly protein TadB